MNQDILYIKEYELNCRIGTTPQERSQVQQVLVTLELVMDLQKAGRSDNLHDAPDYAALAQDIKSTAENKEFNLMEAMAETLASQILAKYRPESVHVQVEKKVLPGMKGAGVLIWRTK